MYNERAGYLENYRGEILLTSEASVVQEIQRRRLLGLNFDDIIALNKHLCCPHIAEENKRNKYDTN